MVAVFADGSEDHVVVPPPMRRIVAVDVSVPPAEPTTLNVSASPKLAGVLVKVNVRADEPLAGSGAQDPRDDPGSSVTGELNSTTTTSDAPVGGFTQSGWDR